MLIAIETDAQGRPTPRALHALARVPEVRPDGTHWFLWQAPGAAAPTQVCRVTPPGDLVPDALTHWVALVGVACACDRLGLSHAEALAGEILLEPAGRVA